MSWKRVRETAAKSCALCWPCDPRPRSRLLNDLYNDRSQWRLSAWQVWQKTGRKFSINININAFASQEHNWLHRSVIHVDSMTTTTTTTKTTTTTTTTQLLQKDRQTIGRSLASKLTWRRCTWRWLGPGRCQRTPCRRWSVPEPGRRQCPLGTPWVPSRYPPDSSSSLRTQ